MKSKKTYGFFSPKTFLNPIQKPYNDMKSYQRFRNYFGEQASEDDGAMPSQPNGLRGSFWSGLLVGAILMLILTPVASGLSGLFGRLTVKDLGASEKITEIMRVLDSHSISAYKEEDLVESMYRGLVSGIGDPYTTYFDKKALADFMQATEGTYAGIGVVVTSDPDDHLVTVVTLYEGAPGMAAGLRPGDKFMKINGVDVSNASLDDVTSMTKGPVGTSVVISVYRPEDKSTFDVSVVREKIDIPTVSSKIVGENIGYIRITQFDRVTIDQFTTAYSDINKKNVSGLIIDLRNNPGGLLDVVSQIADTLAPKGIIVYTEDKGGNKEYTYSDDESVKVPLALIVNGNSASASEVLSGAIKDLGVGVLVGEKTFGKGIVQNLFKLSDGSAIKVTVAKYYTPSGVCIHGEGIVPDYVVEMPEELAINLSSLSESEDVQLQKAIEVLSENNPAIN
ncbi:MAG: S41 family peptidase [Clostridiales bacterium]|nr:S41 family peptidase [Clostridiales bacterium]